MSGGGGGAMCDAAPHRTGFTPGRSPPTPREPAIEPRHGERHTSVDIGKLSKHGPENCNYDINTCVCIYVYQNTYLVGSFEAENASLLKIWRPELNNVII